MSLDSLPVFVLKDICSHLELESVLALLATGSRYFSLLFSPGVVPHVTVFDDEIPKTFRKTLVYLLSSHRHLHTYTIHCSPWDVAVPFISEIPSDSDLFEINLKKRSMKTTSTTYKPRDRDLLALGGSREVGYTYPLFDRFTHLMSINIDFSLPSARKLPSYLAYWTDFYRGMPKRLRQLSISARGYDDAIRGLSALPQDLEVLRVQRVDYEPASSLTVEDITKITMGLFPRLLELLVHVPPIKTLPSDGATPGETSLPDATSNDGPKSEHSVITINGLVRSVSLVFDNGNFIPFRFSPITNEEDGVQKLEVLSLGTGFSTSWSSCSPYDNFLNFPKSLKSLNLGLNHHIPSDNLRNLYSLLPTSLDTLTLGPASSFNGMEELLPRQLTSVTWNTHATPWEINFAMLPPRLRYLSTPCDLCSPGSLLTAPKTLTRLSCRIPKHLQEDLNSVILAELASIPGLKFTFRSY